MSAILKVYRNKRGGIYAVQDRMKADPENDWKVRIWWVPCYRAPGAAKWVKVPGASWHRRLGEAQAELDSIAQGKQLAVIARNDEAEGREPHANRWTAADDMEPGAADGHPGGCAAG
jgi:hypothetical protein